jgi:hypothetical protein
VFISHTGQDADAMMFSASVLKPALEAAGLAVYMDFSNLQLGASWPRELVDAAANSMVVVVVLSRTYTNRFWCMLELDLALHAHAQQAGGGGPGGSRRPLVIPVFYDPVDVVVDAVKIQRRWSGNMPRETLWRDAESEWVAEVDADRWVANMVAMKAQLQNLRVRQRSERPAKDEPRLAAREVVNVAVQHIPPQVAVGEVVGFEEQEAELVSLLVVGQPFAVLWLHGQGGWVVAAQAPVHRLTCTNFQTAVSSVAALRHITNSNSLSDMCNIHVMWRMTHDCTLVQEQLNAPNFHQCVPTLYGCAVGTQEASARVPWQSCCTTGWLEASATASGSTSSLRTATSRLRITSPLR